MKRFVYSYKTSHGMANLFDVQQLDVPAGILARARFDKGYQGVMHLHLFDAMVCTRNEKSKEPGKENKISLVFEGTDWSGCFENPAYLSKDRQPVDRIGVTTFLGYTFNKLDITETSDGGRFFLLKELGWSRRSQDFIYRPEREIAVIHPSNNLEDFSRDLGTMLTMMGVPLLDNTPLREEIFKRLMYNPQRVSPTF